MFSPQVSKIAFGTCKFWTHGFPDVQTLGFSDSGILGFSDSGILGLPDARSLNSLFLTIFQDLLDSMVYLQIGLGVAQRAAKIAFPWPLVKREVCMSREGDCTKLHVARLRSTISSIKNTSNFTPKFHFL